ncbi:MAG: PAS domain S-box protein [Desulfobacteraceae bacterium]|nr:MAG: PAS domain S-box protein [Desulfobacteraceae bacterium]
MKREFSISIKIWLSLSILVFGYMISIVLGFVLGQNMETRLNIASEHLFPATRQSQLALLAFKEQIKYYDDAVVLGEPSFIDSAEYKANNVRNALENIIRLDGIPPDKKEDLEQTLDRFNQFTASSLTVYTKLSTFLELADDPEGYNTSEVDMELRGKAYKLAQETKDLRIELTNWSDEFADMLKRELADISLSTMRQRYLGLIVFVLVVVIALSLIAVIVNRSISRPLEKTFMLEKAVEQSIDGISVSDLSGTISFVNQAWAKMHDYSQEDLIGKHISFFYTEEYFQSVVAPFLKKVEQEGAYAGEIKHRKRNGEEFISMMTATLMKDSDREQTRVMTVARDITNRKEQERELMEAKDHAEAANRALQESLEFIKRTQQHLVESEKMASLGGLVAGVAHEINTPVGVGVTASSFLEDKTRIFSEKVRRGDLKKSDLEKYISVATEASSIIHKNLNRAADLIRSFKQVAVDQSGEVKRTFKLKQYIDELFISLRPKLKRTNHQVQVNCPDDLAIDSFPGVFSQIITNFVINSLSHGFEEKEDGLITLDIWKNGEELFLIYKDDGKGMEEATIKKIFDPFFTTRRGLGGTGLGMHIVYNLVTITLGGQITCQSAPGKGAQFSIRIPI